MTLDYGIVSENDFLALNVSLHYQKSSIIIFLLVPNIMMLIGCCHYTIFLMLAFFNSINFVAVFEDCCGSVTRDFSLQAT